MKKMIILLLLGLFPFQVLAQEENREYRYYYIEKEYSEKFYEKGENDSKYPKLGKSWFYSDKTETSFKKPELKEDIIKETPIVKYQEYQKVRYIIIDETYSDSKINLEEIEVFSKGEKINYKIECTTCSSEFFSKIQNTLVAYEFNYIDNGTEMIIDLQKEYFPDDLTIKFHMGGVAGKLAKFRVTVNNSQNINDVYYRYFVDEMLEIYLESKKDLKNVEHEERLDKDILEKKGVTEVENAKVIDTKTEYTFKKRLYQYYREVKHYVDGYYQDLPGLIKDKDNFRETEPEITTPEIVKEYVEVEKEVHVPEIKTEKVPIEKKVIEYQTKEVKVPVTEERIVEKEVIKKPSPNYPLQYLVYLTSAIILKKMSFFR